jgi:polyhydroxyalkanoate synthesis regulator phasin
LSGRCKLTIEEHNSELVGLENRWDQARRNMASENAALEKRIAEAEYVTQQIADRSQRIKALGEAAASNWLEFVNQVLAISNQLEQQSNQAQEEASRIVSDADRKLKEQHDETVRRFEKKIQELTETLQSLELIFSGKTALLKESLLQLASVNQFLHNLIK